MKTQIPFILLFILVFKSNICFAQVLQQDSLALVAFYNSTGGPDWNNNSNWLTGPVSTWYGVTVEGGWVTKLHIYSNNLNGNIPEEIGFLTQLELFVIGNELGITGIIPNTIYQLSELTSFGIANCSINGTISNGIGNLTKLIEINLLLNNLTGPIPPEIGNLNSLKFLDLHDNQLTGTIPPELGNCTNLEVLRLNNNQLTGTIPVELTNFANLTIYNLSNNQLSGEIPEYLSNLFFQNQANEIDVSYNQFSGAIPESWGNLSFLIDGLNLSFNHFTSLPVVNYNWIITFFHIEGNKLTFEHIESHYQSFMQGWYYFFYYHPQDAMLECIDTALVPGCSFDIYSGTGGEYTNYKWFRNGELILESPYADSLHLTEISFADTGIYTCTASNSLIYFLNLHRQPVHIGIDTGSYIADHAINEGITIFPNPASNWITIEKPCDAENFYLKVSDIHGKYILNQNFKQHKVPNINLDIEFIEPGIYLLLLQMEDKNYITKFIINKQGIHR